MRNRRFSTADREIQGFSPVFPVSQAHLAQQGQQSSVCHPQISLRKQRHELSGVLRQSARTKLHKTKLTFDDPEGVFNNCPYRRQHPVERRQLANGRLLGRCQHGQFAFLRKVLNRPIHLVIAAVSQSDFLLPVQAAFHHLDVGHLGCLHATV